MNPREVLSLDVETFDDEALIVASNLQGLANRRGPRVFLEAVNRHWAMKFKPTQVICKIPGSTMVEPYRSCTDIWRDYYQSVHHMQFVPLVGLADLLDHVRDEVRGIVRIELNHRGQYAVGATLAGLRDAVLVTDAMIKRCPELGSLPVIEDLRGRFADPLEAHHWSAVHLLPLCNKRAIYSQTRTANEGDPDYFALDLAIAQKMFVFSLCFRQAANPAEFALIEEILSKLEPGSPMYGWGTSEESMMIGMAKSGAFLVCTHTPNISFHDRIEPTRKNLSTYLPPPRVTPPLKKKHYVTFMVNEGDTLKWMGSAMGHGQWFSSDRGRVPINWGTNPWLVEKYPGLMEIFYRTISPNDCFFSSITGYGYYNPKYSSATSHFAKLEAQHNPAAGLTVGSIYAVHAMMDIVNGAPDAATDKWLVERGCEGYAFESAQQPYLRFTSANQPVIGVDWSLFYWMHRFEGQDPLEASVREIRRIAREHEAPFFIPVYGGTPEEFCKMAKLLPEDEFEIVTLDQMVALAKAAGQTHLEKDRVRLSQNASREITLTLRNTSQQKRSGTISAKASAGCRVEPTSINYATLGPGEKREMIFKIQRISAINGVVEHVTFDDSGSGLSPTLRVESPVAVPQQRASKARVIRAAHAKFPVAADPKPWAAIASDRVVHDLSRMGVGNAKVQYQFAWNEEHLHVWIEELLVAKQKMESLDQRSYAAGEFDVSDGVAFWMDFTGSGTRERAEFTPWFGLSSTGRRDVYCCQLNTRVLTSTEPRAVVATGCVEGRRVIHAAIPWRELAGLLEDECAPVGGLLAQIKAGWRLGLQPLLIEGGRGRAYLNGKSNKRQNDTAASLEKSGATKVVAPDGFDSDSLVIELSR